MVPPVFFTLDPLFSTRSRVFHLSVIRELKAWFSYVGKILSPPQRLKGFFSGGQYPLSNVSAGTGLQATVESAGYHVQDGRHPGEVIFCGLLAGVACVPGFNKDGVQDFEVT